MLNTLSAANSSSSPIIIAAGLENSGFVVADVAHSVSLTFDNVDASANCSIIYRSANSTTPAKVEELAFDSKDMCKNYTAPEIVYEIADELPISQPAIIF